MLNQSSHLRIDFIGDLALPSAEEVFLVENDHDYVRVCRVISDHFSTDSPLSIRVRKKNHFVWLRNFAEQIGLACTGGEKTARDVLADEWKVSLPDWLDDKTILDEKLLNLPIEAHLPETFQNRFLAHFFGADFQGGTLDAGNLSEIISILTTERATKCLSRNKLYTLSCHDILLSWRKN